MAYKDPEQAREYKRLWRKANREKENATKRRYAEKHPAKVRAAKKRSRKRRKAEIREHDRAYREANREAISARRKERYANDPEYREKIKARANARYKQDPEGISVQNAALKKKRRAGDPEAERAKDRAYYEKNSEAMLATGRRWANANREKVRERGRRWSEENPEKRNAKQRRRRFREAGAEGTHTGEDVQRQYKAQKGRCFWCKKSVGLDYHVDHIVPLAGKERTGSNWPCNIVIACAGCNRSKFNRDPQDYGILL